MDKGLSLEVLVTKVVLLVGDWGIVILVAPLVTLVIIVLALQDLVMIELVRGIRLIQTISQNNLGHTGARCVTSVRQVSTII